MPSEDRTLSADPTPTAVDQAHMERALRLAKKGAGWVDPNPLVGCVIARGSEVLGEGYHTRFGCPHAEREALADCAARGNDPEGATVYVTLEPCSHFGKTPPCCDALIEAGVARVVVGSSDPNPLVAGRGAKALRTAGIEVDEGILQEACDALNAPFFHHVTTGSPYVVAKFASTLDGRIATRTGASQWITGRAARARVHEDRARYAAIMVGVGTVIADDPRLSARVEDPPSPLGIHQPTRVVVDSHLRTPLDANVVRTVDSQPTFIATCVADEAQQRPYKERGCGIIVCPADADGRVDLAFLMRMLGDLGFDSVYVEGGATLLGALFDGQLVDRLDAYIAPKVFGGAQAPASVGGSGVALPSEAAVLRWPRVEQLEDDILISGTVCWEACGP